MTDTTNDIKVSANVNKDGQFEPSAKLRKMLMGNNGTRCKCAYVYADGVALWNETHVKAPGLPHGVDVESYVVIPCKVQISTSDYGTNGDSFGRWNGTGKRTARLVIHEPQMLVHGIARVEVALGNSSDAMKARSMTMTSVTVHTPAGGVFQDTTVNQLASGRISTQPNPYESYSADNAPDSIECYKDEANVSYL